MAVELAELISQLRAELSDALHAGEDSDVRFELGPVELEVTVAAAKEAKPGAKVRFWVVELGADGSASSSSTQRIKLSLEVRFEPDLPDQWARRRRTISVPTNGTNTSRINRSIHPANHQTLRNGPASCVVRSARGRKPGAAPLSAADRYARTVLGGQRGEGGLLR